MKIPLITGWTAWKQTPQTERGIWKNTGNGINPPGMEKKPGVLLSKALYSTKASKTTEIEDNPQLHHKQRCQS